jgi:hypothetical protein
MKKILLPVALHNFAFRARGRGRRRAAWTFFWGTLLSVMPSLGEAKTFEAAAGFSAVEQGDDHMRPAAMLHLGITPFYSARAYLWGRDFGPVKERTTLLSFNRRVPVFKSNAVVASFGLALMDEMIALEFEDEADSAYNTTEHNYKAGMAIGLSWSLIDTGPLYATVSWDSHLFPAGANGAVFLVTGRKQAVSVAMGVTF